MKDKQIENGIELLLKIIDRAYDNKSWHGTNLKGAIRGLKFQKAIWKPFPNQHSIFEIVLHTAYWKYVVTRRLTNTKKGSFPIKGSNWFNKNNVISKDWDNAKKILNQSHSKLREAILRLKLKDLTKRPKNSSIDNLTIIMGIAAHDLYHAGQIQLLKKLMRCKR